MTHKKTIVAIVLIVILLEIALSAFSSRFYESTIQYQEMVGKQFVVDGGPYPARIQIKSAQAFGVSGDILIELPTDAHVLNILRDPHSNCRFSIVYAHGLRTETLTWETCVSVKGIRPLVNEILVDVKP